MSCCLSDAVKEHTTHFRHVSLTTSELHGDAFYLRLTYSFDIGGYWVRINELQWQWQRDVHSDTHSCCMNCMQATHYNVKND